MTSGVVGDEAAPELYLEREEVEARRRERAERYQTVTVPKLRFIGFQLLLGLVVLHDALVLDDPPWRQVAAFAVGVELYCLIAWALLRAFYRRAPRLLPLVFLSLDVVGVFTGAVYVSGAHRSWLFPLVIMHVADQTATTFRRVLGFAHLGVLCYVALIVAVAADPAVDVSWRIELVKITLLYAIALYTALTALTAERLRERLVDTVRVARELVVQLERSSLETERALALSESASRSKSEFLANMSHELRTPLNSVIGFADVLARNRKGNLDAKELSFLARIKDNGVHLLDIISDILDLSRIEAGRLEVDLDPVDLGEVVDEVLASLQAPRPGVRLSKEVPEGLQSVPADRTRLRQVLTNLVGNALKFTESGGVSVRVLAQGRLPRAIEVVDTGIGIAPDRLATVFHPFEQGDNTTKRRFGGTGLGLSISRSLCELMGCRLEAESEEGRGSTFRILLP